MEWGMISLLVVQILLALACAGVFALIFPHVVAMRGLDERIRNLEATPRERTARLDALDERIKSAERDAGRAIEATKSLRGSVAAVSRWVKREAEPAAETEPEDDLTRILRESQAAPMTAPANNGLRPGFGAQPGRG